MGSDWPVSVFDLDHADTDHAGGLRSNRGRGRWLRRESEPALE